MSYLEALRREKAGYEAQGKDDRAAEVDAEIQRIEGAATKRSQSTEPDAVPSGPQMRDDTKDEPVVTTDTKDEPVVTAKKASTSRRKKTTSG